MNRAIMRERLINKAADHFIGMALTGLPESAAKEFRKTALERIETILDELFSINGRELLFRQWLEEATSIRVVGHHGVQPFHAVFLCDSVVTTGFPDLNEATVAKRQCIERFVQDYNAFIEKKRGENE